MTSRTYVSIDGLENEPILCDVVKINPKTNMRKFQFRQRYLQRDDYFEQVV